MKKWYYLEEKGSDKKVGICIKNGIIEYTTRYGAEAELRVCGDLEMWGEEDGYYMLWYYVRKTQPTLAEIRAGLKSGVFRVGKGKKKRAARAALFCLYNNHKIQGGKNFYASNMYIMYIVTLYNRDHALRVHI